ncbi:ketoacyl-ACP synthase III [Clostridium estertheticum]|uniref:3-oxoacyl-[acyl-carrier-protein] synthase III C-terminal domain-containing protein n=1 Tax=Clostridium estertheticum TaxID=238834 RepID=UPI0013E9915E|nr:3-oxoacyl-[acyl-carrier-protein] synthase III C-terminal domain-containing protein [Clostridium estertheticum]MBZ9685296.1 ketoacyl-ACP synthase III [Clostridium estertheticum]
MNNVKILTVDIYHPEKQVDNSYYLKHFKSQGKDITDLLKAFGREKRYIIDNDYENTITMGVEVANKALKSVGLEGKDIDMVLFSSQFPEYTFPSQSLIVHNAINGKEDCMCMDTNTNCAGMLVTVEHTIRAMMGNPHVKRALVIGSDYTSIHCRNDDELTYPNFADGAAAIILEKTEGQGFIDSMCKSNGATWEAVKYPACGLSKVYKKDLSIRDRKLQWIPFEGLFIIDNAVTSIHTLLNRNNLKMEQIKSFCFSQYSRAFSNLGSEKLGVDINKFIYVGDVYGYTGTSSPFIAFHEGIKTGKIKRGDIVCLWSVAINWTICTMLIKY